MWIVLRNFFLMIGWYGAQHQSLDFFFSKLKEIWSVLFDLCHLEQKSHFWTIASRNPIEMFFLAWSCHVKSFWIQCVDFFFFVYFWHLLVFACRLSGVSPFQGESVEETCRNITEVKYEFNPKHFEPISQQGKDFITSLLVKNPK